MHHISSCIILLLLLVSSLIMTSDLHGIIHYILASFHLCLRCNITLMWCWLIFVWSCMFYFILLWPQSEISIYHGVNYAWGNMVRYAVITARLNPSYIYGHPGFQYISFFSCIETIISYLTSDGTVTVLKPPHCLLTNNVVSHPNILIRLFHFQSWPAASVSQVRGLSWSLFGWPMLC